VSAPVNINQQPSMQSPRGKWESKSPKKRRIYIELRARDDKAHSGTFLRVTDKGEKQIHEAGSWALGTNELRLMIFAYDGPGNIDLGTVQVFEFARQGPDQIALTVGRETDIFQRVIGFES
jgi:hypothetical protein